MRLWILLPLAAAEISEEQCRAGQGIQDQGQEAWCCALYGICEETRRLRQAVIQVGHEIYNCRDGLDNIRLYWNVEKQAHCCAELGMGCPEHAFDCESGYMNWVHGWSPGKKIWCCQTTNRGCPPTTMTATQTETTTETTTYPGCQRPCTLENVKVTCEERIHFASVHTFLGEASPCQLAHELVLRECDGLCDQCPISIACLGAANVPTSTPPPTTLPHTSHGPHHGAKDPFDCHEGLEMWQMVWFPAKQEWCCNNKGLGCGERKRKLQTWQTWQRLQVDLPQPRALGECLLIFTLLAGLMVASYLARRRVRHDELTLLE